MKVNFFISFDTEDAGLAVKPMTRSMKCFCHHESGTRRAAQFIRREAIDCEFREVGHAELAYAPPHVRDLEAEQVAVLPQPHRRLRRPRVLGHIGQRLGAEVVRRGFDVRRIPLVGDVEQALRANGLPGQALTLEITESMLLSGDEDTAERLRRLKALGLSIAVDDYGNTPGTSTPIAVPSTTATTRTRTGAAPRAIG